MTGEDLLKFYAEHPDWAKFPVHLDAIDDASLLTRIEWGPFGEEGPHGLIVQLIAREGEYCEDSEDRDACIGKVCEWCHGD